MEIKLSAKHGKEYESLFETDFTDLSGPLKIDFSEVKFFQPFTLTLLYGLFRLHEKLYPDQPRECIPSRYHYLNTDVFQYTQRVDFFKCCKELSAEFAQEGFSRNEAQKFVPITKAYNLTDSEKVAGEIIKIMFPETHPGARQAKYSLSELAGNSAQHSGSPIGAIMNAQLYPDGDLYGAILDGGVGIRKHLEGNTHLAPQITSDQKAIELALVPGHSGTHHCKQEQVERGVERYTNAGYGLSVCSEIAKRSGRFIHVISGKASHKVTSGGAVSKPIAGWPGTIIFFVIDCNNVPDVGGIISEFDRQVSGKKDISLRFDT